VIDNRVKVIDIAGVLQCSNPARFFGPESGSKARTE
jgi:hypothetical protein